jgi:hypothetical protein
LAAEGVAGRYADRLLRSFGIQTALEAARREHPAATWAKSGAMLLTGQRDGAPLQCPAPIASCAAGAGYALAALHPDAFADLDGSALLGERAAISGLGRAGYISVGGSCRMVSAADGELALNLPREADWDLVPAWLQAEVSSDWDAIAAQVVQRPLQDLAERGRLLGLALATEARPKGRAWFERTPGIRRAPSDRPPLVVDLTALWAGPLAGQLLSRTGARVVKVESIARPDGARGGPQPFFDLLNSGKQCIALDFARETDTLRQLVAKADIVIEASRPRALRQLGIDAAALVGAKPGMVWISITGHGRRQPRGDWIGFGDDAGVAGGLGHVMRLAHGASLFCADAVADPLAGLHAAVAALAAYRSGQGGLYAIALADVVSHMTLFEPPGHMNWATRAREWEADSPVPAVPRARAPIGRAQPLGADTERVMRSLCI